jgi:two-component system sensor histidine kinase ChvG
MASAIVTRRPETDGTIAEPAPLRRRGIRDRFGRIGWQQRQPFGRFSLTRRVLFVNILAVAFLGGGMLYLDRYEDGLVDTELKALALQGDTFAGALAEGAVLQDMGEDGPVLVLVPSLAQGMMRRVVEPDRFRTRLFMTDGSIAADSRVLSGGIQFQPLPPPEGPPSPWRWVIDKFSSLLRARNHYQIYTERAIEKAGDYPEVEQALDGKVASMVRSDPIAGGLILSVGVPVRHYKEVLGALLISVGSADLERQVNAVRADILRLFLFDLAFTVLLSLYLAGTIARPVRRLAQAAQDVRRGDGRKVEIPDFGRRRDEIGELSVALTDMTQAIWRRMDAIERFAADVAHEIKNPLSSLRSAVETAARVKDPDQQRRLMAIILDDVQRLDRLISDISDASRLDAEMSRLERAPVAIARMLVTLVQVREATREGNAPSLEFREAPQVPEPLDLMVLGKETRLVQVFQNLIANAISFSPTDGRIVIGMRVQQGDVLVLIDDDGPGIPDGKLTAIFDRFYSERPAGEKFGTHSGLGLSISRQIVEAHGGKLTAENRTDRDGKILGARFVVRLPLA